MKTSTDMVNKKSVSKVKGAKGARVEKNSAPVTQMTAGNVLLILRIRGIRSMAPRTKKTLEFMRLNKPHHCIISQDTPYLKGMINLVKDYVAFGPITEQTIAKILNSKGELNGHKISKTMTAEQIAKISKEIFSGKKTKDFVNPVFRLHPPRKGYKDIKRPYPLGDLGRRDDLDNFILRLL